MEPQDPNTTDPQTPPTSVYQAPPAVPPAPASPPPPGAPAPEPPLPEPYIPPSEEPYASPTVVVPDVTSSRVPKWFLIVFGITLLIFFAITTLLVLSMLQKSPAPAPGASSIPAHAPTGVVPTSIPTAAAASSSSTLQGDGTDEVDSLNAEAQNVDFSDMDETLVP